MRLPTLTDLTGMAQVAHDLIDDVHEIAGDLLPPLRSLTRHVQAAKHSDAFAWAKPSA